MTSWIYCSVIDACRELHELRRAREWTVALNALVRRPAPVFRRVLRGVPHPPGRAAAAGGDWPDAVRAADRLRRADPGLRRGDGRAGALPARRGPPAARRHRRRGRRPIGPPAATAGRPSPGSRCSGWRRGGRAPPRPPIRRALGETADRLARSRLLPAYVEIMLAVPDVAAARDGADRAGRHRRRVRHRRRCRPVRRTPAARCSWPTAARRRRCRRCAARAALARAGRAVRGGPGPGADRAGLPRAAGRGLGRDGAGRRPRGLRQLGAAPDLAAVEALVPGPDDRRAEPPRGRGAPAGRRRAGPTTRSPPSWPSATDGRPGTSATSSPSSASAPGPPRPRTPSHTGSTEHCGEITHGHAPVACFSPKRPIPPDLTSVLVGPSAEVAIGGRGTRWSLAPGWAGCGGPRAERGVRAGHRRRTRPAAGREAYRRRGVPQGRHAHLLVPSGTQICTGCSRVSTKSWWPVGHRWCGLRGVLSSPRRWRSPLRLRGPTDAPFACQASRPYLEEHVRERVAGAAQCGVPRRCDVTD